MARKKKIKLKPLTFSRIRMGVEAVGLHIKGALRKKGPEKPFPRPSHIVLGDKMIKVKPGDRFR